MDCTAPDCPRITSLYLCTTCIIELDRLLQEVPLLIVALDPGLLAQKVTRKPGNEIRTTNKAGSKPPTSHDAMLLQSWLKQLPVSAHAEAMNNPRAGDVLYMARIWVNSANTITHGPEEVTVDHEANRERIKEIAPPMPMRQLVPWLRKHAKISITGMQVRQWVARGKLKQVERTPQPTYHPHEVIETWNSTKKG